MQKSVSDDISDLSYAYILYLVYSSLWRQKAENSSCSSFFHLDQKYKNSVLQIYFGSIFSEHYECLYSPAAVSVFPGVLIVLLCKLLNKFKPSSLQYKLKHRCNIPHHHIHTWPRMVVEAVQVLCRQNLNFFVKTLKTHTLLPGIKQMLNACVLNEQNSNQLSTSVSCSSPVAFTFSRS